jgi:hypothetical protein
MKNPMPKAWFEFAQQTLKNGIIKPNFILNDLDQNFHARRENEYSKITSYYLPPDAQSINSNAALISWHFFIWSKY